MLVIFPFTLASTRVAPDRVRENAGDLSLGQALGQMFRVYTSLVSEVVTVRSCLRIKLPNEKF
jgi:hypothetical protein